VNPARSFGRWDGCCAGYPNQDITFSFPRPQLVSGYQFVTGDGPPPRPAARPRDDPPPRVCKYNVMAYQSMLMHV
jgi:hypothetical protein